VTDSQDIMIEPSAIAEIDTLERVIGGRSDLHSEAQEQEAVAFTQRVKANANALERQRKSHVDPLNKRVKAINKLFQPYIARLSKLEAQLKALVVASVVRREAANRAALQAAIQAAQQGGDAGRHLDAIDDRQLPPATSLRKRWGFQIVNPALIPLQLWSPDPAKIAAYVDQFTDFDRPPEIPGVVVTVDGSLTVRAARSGPRKPRKT